MPQTEPGSAAFSLGDGARIGKISVDGNVAGRDVVVGTTPGDAAAVQDRQQLLVLLTRLEEHVAGLQEAPAGLRGDAQDELRKAREASEQGDSDRATEKLHVARGYLERIGQNLPAAVSLAQTVASIALRMTSLG